MKRMIAVAVITVSDYLASDRWTGYCGTLFANVKNSTCKSEISNQGNIIFGVVGVGYFSGNVTPESYQPGGKEFTVTVSDCALQGTGDVLNQLHIDFRALSGVMAAGSRQIFANEVTTGAKNVGVVLFPIQEPANIFDALSSARKFSFNLSSNDFFPE